MRAAAATTSEFTGSVARRLLGANAVESQSYLCHDLERKEPNRTKPTSETRVYVPFKIILRVRLPFCLKLYTFSIKYNACSEFLISKQYSSRTPF